MTVTFRKLHPLFAAEAAGVDLSQPLDPSTLEKVITGMDEHAVLVFHGPRLTEEEQVAFASRLGPLEPKNGVLSTGLKQRVSPKLVDISNLDENNGLLERNDRRRMFSLGNRLWHTDSSFKKTPAKYSLLHAHTVVPEGGETQFVDTRAAYDALPAKMKQQLDELVVEHSIFNSRAKLGFTEFSGEERLATPPVLRRLVLRHPGSGRKALYLASHASHIVDWPVPEGRILLQDLIEHATQPQFVHTHRWQVGDLVIWDNRCTMHRARPFDADAYSRDMRRATVQDRDPAQQDLRVA